MRYWNSEHYTDPTAGRALANMAREARRAGRKGRNRGRGAESRGRRGKQLPQAPEPAVDQRKRQNDIIRGGKTGWT